MTISGGMFNRLWRDRYPALPTTPGEMIHLDRETGPGTKKFKRLQMGMPRLEWKSIDNSISLALSQRALRELEVTLTTEPGAEAPWMNHIRKMEMPAERVLTIDIIISPTRNIYELRYATQDQKAVTLVWRGPTDYAYSGSDTDKRLLSEHYDAQKSIVVDRLVLAPVSMWLQDVALIPHGPPANGLVLGLHSRVLGGSAMESDLIAPALPLDVDGFHAVSELRAFPENLYRRPLDSSWMASLLVPGGTASIDPSQDHLEKGSGFRFGYRRSAGSAGEPNDVAVAVEPVSVSPLISIVGAGFERQLIEIADFKNATVDFVGDWHGSLERGSDAWYYVPPPYSSSVVYETNCKTLQPPARVETLRERAVVDVIKVTVDGNSGLSTFVSLYVKQTHYIKCLVADSRLTLELWYYDEEEEKNVRVPAELTEWSTLQGNGSVSRTGVFTPNILNPSTVSVISGRDLASSGLLYWAVTVIPVPLFSATDAVTFFND